MADQQAQFELAPIFAAVGQALSRERQTLNQADAYNGNHGDHMVMIFEIATQAAGQMPADDMAGAMEHAANILEEQADNGSAQVYARGLRQVAGQLRKYDVTLDELVLYVRGALAEDKESRGTYGGFPAVSGDVLKALLAGLAAWGQDEQGQPPTDKPLDMGVLFEFGMAYLQAKQRGGERVEILADAAASVTPLGKVPHRYQSGKIAIQALLRAMQEDLPDLS